jgi:uncharacterized protein
MSVVTRIALALVIIGAINWGLIGLFQFDLVATLFGGQDSAFSRIIYSLVGLSGLWCIGLLFKDFHEHDYESSRASTGRVAYGTEFAEENDVTSIPEKRE